MTSSAPVSNSGNSFLSSSVSMNPSRSSTALPLDMEDIQTNLVNASPSLTNRATRIVQLSLPANPRISSAVTEQMNQELETQGDLKFLHITLTNPLNQQSTVVKGFPVCLLKRNAYLTSTLFDVAVDWKANESELNLDKLLTDQVREKIQQYPQIWDLYRAYRLGQTKSISLPEEAISTLITFSQLMLDPHFAVSIPQVAAAIAISTQDTIQVFSEALFDRVILGTMASDDKSPEYPNLENFISNPFVWKHVLSDPKKLTQLHEAATSGHLPALYTIWYYNTYCTNNAPAFDFAKSLAKANQKHILFNCIQHIAFKQLLTGERSHSPLAMTLLGDFYFNNIRNSDKNHPQQAFYWLNQAAERGNRRAMEQLGICYRDGIGINEDPQLAVHWFKQAAERGSSGIIMVLLAKCYFNGTGVDKDDKLAAYWYNQAAERGDLHAMYVIGDYYRRGIGVDQDNKLAAHWFKQAAEGGVPAAMFYLGHNYFSGYGVDKNFQQAVHWFKQAAERDVPDAMYSLGYCYYNGSGVDQDRQQGISLFVQAAERGISRASKALGEIFSNQDILKETMERAQNLTDAKQRMSLYNQIILAVPYQFEAYKQLISLTQDVRQKTELLLKAAHSAEHTGNLLLGVECRMNALHIALAEFNRENILAQQEEMINAARRTQNLPYTGQPHASRTFNLNERVMYLAQEILELIASGGLDDEKRKQVQDILNASREYFGKHC